MFRMIKFEGKQNAFSQLNIIAENERKYGVNDEVVKVFTNAIQSGLIINDFIPSNINTDQAANCFKTAHDHLSKENFFYQIR
jgi:hypothetical protein